MNIVVLTAALSVYNSSIYSNARMLYSLAKQGNAPKLFMKLSKTGTPVAGVLVSSVLTLVAVILNYLVPGKVFMYFMSVATIALIITWVMILVANLEFRKTKAGQTIEFKTPWHPISNYVCLAFMGLLVIFMTQIPDMKMVVYILPVWLLILWVGYKIKKSSKSNSTAQNHIH